MGKLKNKSISTKFKIVCADPPYNFSDSLKMSKIKRSAKSQYKSVLSIKEIKELPVKEIVDDNSILALWVPSSMLQDGLDIMECWGFKQKQTHIWVKTKKNALSKLFTFIFKKVMNKIFNTNISDEYLVNILGFGMGRIFRQTHEIVLIGTRGKVSHLLKNKSQRSVHFGPVKKHSEKPEALQDMLDIMYPSASGIIDKIELFARRDRPGWLCLGNECPSTKDEDIRDSLKKIIKKIQ